MSKNKIMIDNDIMEALKYCSEQGSMSECEKCKVKKGCRAKLIEYALYLLSRKDARIEYLYGEIARISKNTVELYSKELDEE